MRGVHGKAPLKAHSSPSTIAFFVALAIACAGCPPAPLHGQGASSQEEHALLGVHAPDFQLKAQYNAEQVSLANGAGKLMLVDFWATWCTPCKESFPAYQRLLDKYAGELVILGISVDDDDHGIVGFGKETGVRFPLAWDEGQGVARQYQPPTMPTSYLIDRNGIVRYVHAGFHAGDEAGLEAKIHELLK